MKKHYDAAQANRMRPFIASIARELDERRIAVRSLERRLRRIEGDEGPIADDDDRRATTVAALAEHRRNIRHAGQEVEGLGGEIESGHPAVIRLPGPDGRFESGFRIGARGQSLPVEQVA